MFKCKQTIDSIDVELLSFQLMAFKYLFVSPVFINLNRHLFNLSTRMMSSKKAIVLLTDGVEEMEAVTTADVLRRAQVCRN